LPNKPFLKQTNAGEMNFKSIQNHQKRSLALDAVRGLAILMVVIYHFGDFGLLPFISIPYTIIPALGMFGVDLFYVLSGFFITKAIISPTSWDPGIFLKARFSRIYPAYLFSLLFFAAYKISSGNSIDFQLMVNLLLHSLMLHNLFPGVGNSFNGTYWTLGVEFPYYFLMLAIGYFLREKRYFWHVSLSMLAICLVWRASVFQFMPTDMGRFFAATQLPGVLDAFSFGGMAAVITRHAKYGEVCRRWRWPIFMVGLVATVLSLYYVTHHAGHYWSYAWTVIMWRTSLAAGFALLIVACNGMEYSKFLHYSGLPWLGKISFSLYIYHLFPAILILKFFPEFGWEWKLLLASSIALAMSWASWRFIEARFHRTSIPVQ
jgi:peptidoglycan/LPS O-acetylase OafA/YrhL